MSYFNLVRSAPGSRHRPRLGCLAVVHAIGFPSSRQVSFAKWKCPHAKLYFLYPIYNRRKKSEILFSSDFLSNKDRYVCMYA